MRWTDSRIVMAIPPYSMESHGWRMNPEYGLCMSAADMAKIGQLCLNKGIWEGNRIISEEWITEMTRMFIHR